MNYTRWLTMFYNAAKQVVRFSELSLCFLLSRKHVRKFASLKAFLPLKFTVEYDSIHWNNRSLIIFCHKLIVRCLSMLYAKVSKRLLQLFYSISSKGDYQNDEITNTLRGFYFFTSRPKYSRESFLVLLCYATFNGVTFWKSIEHGYRRHIGIDSV